jgi:hypothetical protein
MANRHSARALRRALSIISGACLLMPAGATATTFTYTGTEQHYTVPSGVTVLHVVAAGASGGTGVDPFGAFNSTGGLGATVQANIRVTPGETLYVEVGGSGGNGTDGTPGGGLPGFNGGGASGQLGNDGAGGGGASDVRLISTATGSGSLNSRLIVAGGGGGGGGGTGGFYGGAAGADGTGVTPSGVSGLGRLFGGGDAGTLSHGGAGGRDICGFTRGPAGSFGAGGDGAGGNGGGGGGGYYGGGGGSICGGGGGGSSYVSPEARDGSIGPDTTGTPQITLVPRRERHCRAKPLACRR